eukprot:TRINITY_DN32754_c0_g1_i1.p1 TRINITY_DN32754_c0_g1~~TRINITY_DN32754_c0_g1_i1.p1  ORF type:complete len:188 (-),score=31.85 TRINITY_DN32754_c0_g1_i1:94-603(-)
MVPVWVFVAVDYQVFASHRSPRWIVGRVKTNRFRPYMKYLSLLSSGCLLFIGGMYRTWMSTMDEANGGVLGTTKLLLILAAQYPKPSLVDYWGACAFGLLGFFQLLLSIYMMKRALKQAPPPLVLDAIDAHEAGVRAQAAASQHVSQRQITLPMQHHPSALRIEMTSQC